VKLHELRPPKGAHKPKRRVGRGIAAGQGKTAGRGTKGQQSRAGGNLPAWFEGGQTPLHQRIPKLRGFRNPFKVEYEIVNLGAIARLVELGALEPGEHPDSPKRGAKNAAPITVNQEILRGAGVVRTLDKPMKVLGAGELSTALFVVADAFSSSAKAKIEAAGGSVSVLEVPGRKTKALGVETAAAAATPEPLAEGAPAAGAGASAALAEASPGLAKGQPEPLAASDAPAPAPDTDAESDQVASKPRTTRVRKAEATAEPEVEAEKPEKATRSRKAAPKSAAAADEAAPDADPGDDA
jgi:large subunit ribosomal protein L15